MCNCGKKHQKNNEKPTCENNHYPCGSNCCSKEEQCRHERCIPLANNSESETPSPQE